MAKHGRATNMLFPSVQVCQCTPSESGHVIRILDLVASQIRQWLSLHGSPLIPTDWLLICRIGYSRHQVALVGSIQDTRSILQNIQFLPSKK